MRKLRVGLATMTMLVAAFSALGVAGGATTDDDPRMDARPAAAPDSEPEPPPRAAAQAPGRRRSRRDHSGCRRSPVSRPRIASGASGLTRW
jgi:hypothetical protein